MARSEGEARLRDLFDEFREYLVSQGHMKRHDPTDNALEYHARRFVDQKVTEAIVNA